jgi:hypothetical protein
MTRSIPWGLVQPGELLLAGVTAEALDDADFLGADLVPDRPEAEDGEKHEREGEERAAADARQSREAWQARRGPAGVRRVVRPIGPIRPVSGRDGSRADPAPFPATLPVPEGVRHRVSRP